LPGVLLISPAGAHVGGTLAHLWDHLKPKVTNLVYTKTQSNARYPRKAEATRVIGATGQPGFNHGNFNANCFWSHFDFNGHSRGGFFKDGDGVVHLQGVVKAVDGVAACTSGGSDVEIFQLPTGYRPSERKVFMTIAGGNTVSRVNVDSDGKVSLEDDAGLLANAESFLSLDGLSFRAGS
jgi:hypothetical protein